MTIARCHCRSCRYDLAGLAAGPCPECGVAFDPANPESFTDLRAPRGIVIGSFLLAALPWTSVLAMYGAWCVGRLHLGYWPRPYRPDPKSVPELYSWLDLAGGLLSLACYLFPVAALAIAGLLGYGAMRRRQWAVVLGLLLLLSWGLVITTLWIDPGDVFTWYFD